MSQIPPSLEMILSKLWSGRGGITTWLHTMGDRGLNSAPESSVSSPAPCGYELLHDVNVFLLWSQTNYLSSLHRPKLLVKIPSLDALLIFPGTAESHQILVHITFGNKDMGPPLSLLREVSCGLTCTHTRT